MFSNSMHRPRRFSWRFFLGLSVLGLLIIASASHANAGNRLLATGGVAQVADATGGGLTPAASPHSSRSPSQRGWYPGTF
jgi:hypothetical protein